MKGSVDHAQDLGFTLGIGELLKNIEHCSGQIFLFQVLFCGAVILIHGVCHKLCHDRLGDISSNVAIIKYQSLHSPCFFNKLKQVGVISLISIICSYSLAFQYAFFE